MSYDGIEERIMRKKALFVFEKIFAMVGGEDNQGVLEPSGHGQFMQQELQQRIDISDSGIIAIGQELKICWGESAVFQTVAVFVLFPAPQIVVLDGISDTLKFCGREPISPIRVPSVRTVDIEKVQPEKKRRF